MQSVKCPHCDNQFSLDDIMKKKADEMLSKERLAGTVQLEKERENLLKQKIELEKEQRNVQATISKELLSQRAKLENEVRKELEISLQSKVDFLEAQAREREDRLKKAVDSELNFRAKISDVERKEQELNLTIQSEVAEKSKQIQQEISKKISEDYKRKDQERDLQLSDLRNQIVEWKQKAEQGSQQLQGEALELELESSLKAAFPSDRIDPVAKGVNGADLIHDVLGLTGQRYGRIIWESKRTKNFSNGWITKLKGDRNEAKADVAILVTEAMPEAGVRIFESEGVWIIRPEVAIGVASMIRGGLRDVAGALAISNSRSEKSEIVFNYLTSPTFRQRLETVVESFTTMRDDLEKEKRVTQRAWKHREALLENIFQASLGMYSDIRRIVGGSTFQIAALEYPSTLEIE